jgi:DNA gyrase inhibitor GyrI
MNRYSVTFLALLSFLVTASFAHALELPKVGTFEVKRVKDLNILYVRHQETEGHISNTLIKLIQYYLLRDDGSFEVVFPQLSIESSVMKGRYYAIGYIGNPVETEIVKTTTLKGGLFASYIFQGNYKYISKGIRKAFQQALKTGKYVPHDKEEIRLLYWNSIDDNHPKHLITEIQVRVSKLP